jgi:hypothetical protein
VPQVRPSVPGPKMIFFQRFYSDGSAAPNGFSLKDSFKAIDGASPRRFRPRYAGANLGHPSITSSLGGWSCTSTLPPVHYLQLWWLVLHLNPSPRPGIEVRLVTSTLPGAQQAAEEYHLPRVIAVVVGS